jgi:hypothetical protein
MRVSVSRADASAELTAAKTTFAVVLHAVLEDVQLRLVYRAQAVAAAEVAAFAPTAADVDYPALLHAYVGARRVVFVGVSEPRHGTHGQGACTAPPKRRRSRRPTPPRAAPFPRSV